MPRSLSCVVALVILPVALVLAETSAFADLDVNTQRVIVFKDGYCMFVKQASGGLDATAKASIDGVPDAMVLGSFWVLPNMGKITDMVAKQQILLRQGRQQTEKSLALAFNPEMANQEVQVTMLYFSPGIRWIPTYRIALHDDGSADLSMQAEILNEAEDLSGVATDLVVGVPNFRFKDVVSPMSLEATLRNALAQVAPQIMSQSMSNILMSQRAGEMYAPREESGTPSQPAVPALPPELAGKESHDLFLYHIPQLSLRTGERAVIPLIAAEIPVRHIYTWDVRLSRSGAEAVPGASERSSPVKLLKNDIWRQIDLTNKTEVPWTTGSAIVMDGYLPIAQELLTYTPTGADCRLPLTIAMDVRGTYDEDEIGRDLKGIHFDGNDYVRISKKGSLRVTNHKKEIVELTITCQFGGNATKASDDGKFSVSDFNDQDWSDFRGSRALTGHTTITWDLVLGAGETKDVTCEYYYYTR
ncbi:hypothetical protein HZA56_15355 [Candidatus Poribacteria bacterium]|nr:hypothetical protein [Candidatus Poribacteria bacterium]